MSDPSPTPLAMFLDIFERFNYPTGESQVRLKRDPKPDEFILAEAFNWSEMMDVMVAAEVLRKLNLNNDILMPYLPFARHDRAFVRGDGEPLTVLRQIYLGLTTHNIVVIDPHSTESEPFRHIPQSNVANAALHMIHDHCGGKYVLDGYAFAIPDKGAVPKALTWLTDDDVSVQCLKVRDGETGALSGFDVIADQDQVKGKRIILVDDICDGGGTFIGLAAKLVEMGAESIDLVVTHGLFTKGVDELLETFHRIYTLENYAPRIDPARHLRFGFIKLETLYNGWINEPITPD